MGNVNLICADVLEWGLNYTGPLFHALLADMPYHLTIDERFGKEDSAPAKEGVYARASRGFMGQTWDGGDLAYRVDTWEVFKKLLLPGAFGMAFNSSRGWHRMATAIEDAGFVIHPSIFLFGWATGQGFPKATNISKNLSKRRGVRKGMSGSAISNEAMLSMSLEERSAILQYELALVGHRYGGQAIKPALEPVVVFQKPYEGDPLEVITRTGAGALNIDAARLATKGDKHDFPRGGLLSDRPDLNKGSGRHKNGRGRWPANLVLVHHPGCKLVGKVRRGVTSGDVTGDLVNAPKSSNVYGSFDTNTEWIAYGEGDGTEFVELWECHNDCQIRNFEGDSRFYYQTGWYHEVFEQLISADPIMYEPKATRGEREAGLDDRRPRTVGDGRKKSIDNPFQRGETERHNIHPTVKPVLLMEWLASLLLPSSIYTPRRLFVPCAGVASEMLGARRAGWDEITGVEIGEEYVQIGQKRLNWWEENDFEFETVEIRDNQQTLF